MVAVEDDHGVLPQAQFIDPLEQPADGVVEGFDIGQIPASLALLGICTRLRTVGRASSRLDIGLEVSRKPAGRVMDADDRDDFVTAGRRTPSKLVRK